MAEKTTDIKGSGAAGKPGETTAHSAHASGGAAPGGAATANARKATAQDEALKDLTSDGVSALLRGQFAAEEPTTEDAPDQTNEGVQAGATEGGADAPEGAAIDEDVTAEPPSGGANETEVAPASEEAGGEEAIPEALASAIAEWEASGAEGLPGALQGLVDRRIGKLTGARDEERTARETAERRAAAAEAEVAELKATGATGVAKGSGISSERELDGLEETALRVVSEAEAVLDESATAEETARVQRWMQEHGIADSAGLKRKVRELNTWLNREVPKERQRLQVFRQQEAAVEPLAKQLFPWLEEKASPEYQQAQKALQLFPDLKQRTPAHKLALGIYVLGVREFEKLEAAYLASTGGTGAKAGAKAPLPAAEGNRPTKPPPKAPVGGAAPPSRRVNGKEAQEEAARARFAKTPTRESVTELLKAQL